MIHNSYQQGFSLVEVILSSSVFILLATALVGGYLYGQESTALSGNRDRAVMLAEEGLEATRNIRDESFSNLTDGTHGIATSSNQWVLSGSSDTTDIFTREVVIAAVDGNRKNITANISWQQNEQRSGIVSLVTRLANWLTQTWSQTTQAEFDTGGYNSAESASSSGGEVLLEIEGDWTAPQEHLLADLSGGNNAEALFQEDNVLWIARADSTLYKYDTSDISRGVMTELATYDIGDNTPTGLYISGGKAYVSSTNGDEVAIIDIPTNTVDANINLSGGANATDIVVANNKILITRLESGESEFYVYDITGSTELGIVEVGSDVNAVVADSTYAYLATGDSSELWVIDYNDCTGGGNECSVSATYDPSNGGNTDAGAIFKVGNNIYLGRDNNWIHSIDISSIGSITENYSVDPGNDAVLDLYADENVGFIYAVTDDGGSEELNIVRISDQATYDINLDGNANANAILKQGAYIYIASDDGNEIKVWRGGQGGWTSLQLHDTYNTGGNDNGNDVFVSGNYAYLATDADFYVLNISNPDNVTSEDSINFNFGINDVYVSGNYAYLATDDDDQELTIVDVSNPSNIAVVSGGTFDTDSGSNGLAVWVDGTTAYITTSNNGGNFSSCANSELYAIDVSNPSSPSCLGSYDVTDQVNDVQVSGNYAYLATNDNSSEMLILDISNPSSISETYAYDGDNDWNGLYLTGTTLYGASDDGGGDPDFFVFDVTTPSAPSLTTSYDTGDQNNDVRVSGDYAYLATNQNSEGLTILDISDAGSGTITQTAAYDTGSVCNGIDFDGTYVHLACENNNPEYYLIGQSASPSNYSFEGWFTSVSFDSGGSGTSWTNIEWTESGTGTLQFRLRTAPDSGGSPGTWTDWLGPTGTSDYYTTSAGESINSTHGSGGNDQWIQYRAYLSGDSSATPIFEDITITYE